MAISAVTPVTAGSSVSEATAAAPVQPAPSATDDALTRFSGPAQFLGKLQDMMKTNPAQAKQALGQIAGKLRAQAQQAGGTESARLTDLADRFQKAADTGDLSGLKPTSHVRQSPHAHMMHGKAQAAYSANATDADPIATVLNNLSTTVSSSIK